jgi:hypothetical protein
MVILPKVKLFESPGRGKKDVTGETKEVVVVFNKIVYLVKSIFCQT